MHARNEMVFSHPRQGSIDFNHHLCEIKSFSEERIVLYHLINFVFLSKIEYNINSVPVVFDFIIKLTKLKD